MLPPIAHTWRVWKHAKGVFVLAVCALAVGLGAATAIFTIVNQVLLKPIGYAEGERYVALFSSTVGFPASRGSLVLRDVLEYERASRSFDVFGWFRPRAFNLTAPGSPEHVEGTEVTTTLAQSVGVQPIVGRWFQDEHEAVISRGLWMRLGGSQDLVGRPVVLNGRTYTITGVMPERFRLPEIGHAGGNRAGDVWVGLDPAGRGQDPGDGFTFAYARLKAGVTLAQADAEIKTIAAGIARRDPAQHRNYTAVLDLLHELVTRQVRPTLLLLLAVAALLVLLTCANVAALLLAQAVARARDTALRVALGATRRQLALQYLVEGLFVAAVGAAAGLLVAYTLVRLVVRVAAEYIPRAEEVAFDWRVLAFAGILAALATSLSSLAPLWQAVRTQPNDALNEGVRSTAGRGSRRLSHALVIGEIALAFTLLAISAVLVSNLNRLSRVWPGFDTNTLLTFRLTIQDAIASRGEVLIPHQIRLIEALKALPGVSGAAFTNQTPLDGCCLSLTLFPDGAPPTLQAPQKTAFLPIPPGYFDTIGIPLRRGRLLTYQDADADVLQVVINEAAARHYWPDRDALGASGRMSSTEGSPFQVVGVVADTKNDTLREATVPEVYMLHTVALVNPMHVVVRSPLPPSTLIPEIRRAIQRFDPQQPMHDVRTMTDIAYQSVALERVASLMTGLFAAAALLMATLGIYGVISYAVRQRTVEMGTRLALGATARDLLALVVGDGLRLTLVGLGIGAIAVGVASTLLVRAFEIPQLGWTPFAVSTAAITAVMLTASFVPGWRTTWLSPMVAIRNEPGGAWQAARERVVRTMKSLSLGDDVGVPSADASLIPEFADAARRADSSRAALHLALAALRDRLDVQWAVLLEHDGATFARVADVGVDEAANAAVPNRGFLLGRLQFHSVPLPMSPRDFDAWRTWAGTTRPGQVEEVDALEALGVRLAAAIRTRDRLAGVLALGAPNRRNAYSAQDRRIVRHAADQLALMLENARLTARIVEQEKVRRDLALAAEVQRRLLPQAPPQTDIGSLAAVTVAARSVAGDYYDFLVGEHRLGIAVADVSGKGIAAALIMSAVQASLRIISSEPDLSLPILAARMNSFLHRATQSNSYATFFYAQIEERTGRLRYVNAGHNPPYLVRASTECGSAKIEELKAGGTVLGLFPDMTYDEAAVDLQPGDVLFMFTDGVTEALNPGDEEFGEQRLRDLLREVRHLPVDELTARVSEALRAWSAGAIQNDDLTFVVMKVR